MTEFNIYRVYYYSAPQYDWARPDRSLPERGQRGHTPVHERRPIDSGKHNRQRRSPIALLDARFPRDDTDDSRRKTALRESK